MFDQEPSVGLVAQLVAAAEDPTGSKGGLIDQVAGWERVQAWAAAMQAKAAATFCAARTMQDRAEGVPVSHAGRYAVEEIALARRVSTTAGAGTVALAESLVEDHPQVLAGMLAGDISMHAARVITNATTVLPQHARRAVDAVIAPEAAELTPGQVRAAASRRVLEADPAAAERRAGEARAATRVSLIPGPDATAAIWAGLPAEQAVTCWESLDQHARSLRSAGDSRSLDHLRCDTFVERLTGAAPGTTGAPRVEMQVVISAATLLGLDSLPARLSGYGALPAGIARGLARGPDTFFRRLVTDPIEGRLLARGDRRYRIPKALREAVIARDQCCRQPGSTAPIREVDHIDDYAHGGRTRGANLGGAATRNHHCKHHRGFDVVGDANGELTWITPTGHRYPSRPPPVLGHGSKPWTPPPTTTPWTMKVLEATRQRR